MKRWVLAFTGAWIIGLLTAGSLRAQVADTLSLREREPEGWTNLLADFSDWERVAYSPQRPLTEPSPWKWNAETGILDCQGEGIHELLLHKKPQANGVIHVEWRYTAKLPKPNTGLFFRTSDNGAIWVQAHMSTSGLGSLVGVVGAGNPPVKVRAGEKDPSLQRPDGEWNVMEVTCSGPEITLWINGKTTAVMKDCPVPKGRIGLEAEFHPVQFRNFFFKPLPDSAENGG